MAAETIPDQDALRHTGERVRERLAASPEVYRVPVDGAEIFAVGDFLTPAECDRFIGMIDAVARPSALYEAPNTEGFRTSYSGDFEPSDPFVQAVSRRIDDLLGIASEWGETIQGQRYAPGQEFKPHCDWFHTDQPYWQNEAARGGQRSWTAMAFLNTVEEGGATSFTALGIDIAPQPGVLLIWNNAAPDGTPNHATIHAGTPVIRGVKYVLTKWYRTRSWL
ncbi:2OG-Fe(II) oxygenase [Erythrobacteraceae bacterium CFH 75059]|uniref:prolyl hydroxylase family protein n=1 Tax=Qipengyuania thermophila TaxID=2509361 RepID=UPI00101EE21C|nr:2OG-Fe(II) oxygenase [Qipengyuania thermophila]TCD04970.1 2OG-Fe(II) oxygenase [Erythrobacteraceae bacterium CFH 75059]